MRLEIVKNNDNFACQRNLITMDNDDPLSAIKKNKSVKIYDPRVMNEKRLKS